MLTSWFPAFVRSVPEVVIYCIIGISCGVRTAGCGWHKVNEGYCFWHRVKQFNHGITCIVTLFQWVSENTDLSCIQFA